MRSRSGAARRIPRTALVPLLALATAFAMPARADGPPWGFPLCTMPGDQARPATLSVNFPMIAGPYPHGGLLVWEDGRGAPDDPSDLWSGALNDGFLLGDVLPADGWPLVQRPGTQSDPAIALAVPSTCPFQGGCLTRVIAYVEEDGAGVPSVRARRTGDPVEWDLPVAPFPLDQYEPRAAMDAEPGAAGGSGAFVAWMQALPGGASQLRIQRMGVDGSRLWGEEGLAVVPDTSGQSAAFLCTAAGGGVLLAWADARFSPDLAVYALRLLSDGTPAPGWPPEGRLVQLASGLPAPVGLVPTADGGCFVAWSEGEPVAGGGYPPQPRVVRLLGDGAIAPAWPAAGVPLVSGSMLELDVDDFRADGSGGVCASIRALDAEPRLLLQRLSADGGRPAGWPASGLAACTAAGGQSESRLVAEGGTLTVVWCDARVSSEEAGIYAARLRPDGSRPDGWPATGLAVGDGPGRQHLPVIVSGDYGAVFVAWVDQRDEAASGADLWAQKVLFDGRLDAESPGPPAALDLAFAGPQPAGGTARFRLALPEAGPVRAAVFDVGGRRLATLVDGRMEAGTHDLAWAGAGAAGPGVRFLRVVTPAGERSLRFVTLR